MFKNYLKIAWRNLLKNRTLTILNLAGLTFSLTACIIISLWVKNELSYDQSGTNADRVFRIGKTLKAKGQPDKHFSVTSPPLMPALIKDFPEIENGVRFSVSTSILKYNNKNFFTDHFLYADSGFFNLFGYRLLKGDPHSALVQRNSIVLSESTAKKYFGSEEAIGKTILMNDTIPLLVTGIAQDLPVNNHFHFDMVASSQLTALYNNWWFDNFYTYILLKDPASSAILEKKISNIMDKYNGKQNAELGFTGIHFLQPLKSIHLHSDLRGDLEPGGNLASLKIFIGIGLFLLIVTCINYINISTAGSFKRAKEIGMRKVSGAVRGQLVSQFLSESVLLTMIALLFSIGLAHLGLPIFNSMAGTSIPVSNGYSVTVILVLVIFGISLGLIAGIYPALYLSRLMPLNALKKISSEKTNGISLRKSLVVFQFSLSIFLTIATIVALQQLRFMQSGNLGFSNEQVLAIQLRNSTEIEKKEVLKKNFESHSGIVMASSSSSTPGKVLSNITVLPEGFPPDRVQTMSTLVVDYSFFDTYKLSLAAGRNFSPDHGGDSSGFMLNETAVQELGWLNAQNAIGKKFNWGLGKEGTIIGVVKDFHYNSLQKKIPPMVMHLMRDLDWYSFISVRINTTNTGLAISSLEKAWNQNLPGHPFEFFFVDEDFNRQYSSERQLGKLSALFSVMIIFISCLGLFGLVMISVSHRIKEIGVRKVLGASVPGIASLLSGSFLKLVLISIVIASPLAWWIMDQWLQSFVYRIDISWWMFALAAFIAVFIALLTVSFQAIRAARANPVRSLRSE